MTFSDLGRLFDNYNRVARVYPALITIAPPVFAVAVLQPKIFDSVRSGSISVILAVCLLYLMASVARSRGKVVEKRLLDKWDGWPTTTMLRHGDQRVDPITKERYHKALSDLCGGINMPSEEVEKADASAADYIYRSVTKRLIEARRDRRYQMLHAENASYGFRRNLLGLKPIALTLAAGTGMVLGAIVWKRGSASNDYLSALSDDPILATLISVDFAYILVFALLVTPPFVFQAACEYAEALLRTLDETASVPRSRSSGRKRAQPQRNGST